MTRRWWVPIAAIFASAAVPVGAIALGSLFVPGAGPADGAHQLARDLSGDDWHQVSIEQHVIIRISPANPAELRDTPPPASQPLPERLKERTMPPCMPITAIAGVRPLASNRLLLFLRDHRLVGADLSRNCAARDFYLGFYVAPTSDGMVCAGRDAIHSRAGATCTITQVHELVPAN